MQSRKLSIAEQIAFWLALAFASFIALDPTPPQVITLNNDKLGHMLAFGTLALLGALSFRRVDLLRLGERLSFVGALVEVLQAIPALHRDCDIRDWIADTAAIALVLLSVAWFRRTEPPQEVHRPRPLVPAIHIALIGLAFGVVIIALTGLLNGPMPHPATTPKAIKKPALLVHPSPPPILGRTSPK